MDSLTTGKFFIGGPSKFRATIWIQGTTAEGEELEAQGT